LTDQETLAYGRRKELLYPSILIYFQFVKRKDYHEQNHNVFLSYNSLVMVESQFDPNTF